MIDDALKIVVGENRARSVATTKATPLDVDMVYRDSSSAFTQWDGRGRTLPDGNKLLATTPRFVYVTHPDLDHLQSFHDSSFFSSSAVREVSTMSSGLTRQCKALLDRPRTIEIAAFGSINLFAKRLDILLQLFSVLRTGWKNM